MNDSDRIKIAGRNVVLYDGVCGLCNFVVRFLLRFDRRETFVFVPLESPLAEELLAPFGRYDGPEGVNLLTAALTSAQQLFRRSDAVLHGLRLLGGAWSVPAAIYSLVPRGVRERSYGFIARHRYQIFGRYDTCPIPTPEQRGRILGVAA